MSGKSERGNRRERSGFGVKSGIIVSKKGIFVLPFPMVYGKMKIPKRKNESPCGAVLGEGERYMKYPKECKNVIDVTKPPYSADNTGVRDCTDALIRVLDDVLKGYVTEFEKTRNKLYELSNNLQEDVYIGRETGRVIDGKLSITFPEFIPPAKIIYFPKGVYRISDTVTYSMKNINTWQ